LQRPSPSNAGAATAASSRGSSVLTKGGVVVVVPPSSEVVGGTAAAVVVGPDAAASVFEQPVVDAEAARAGPISVPWVAPGVGMWFKLVDDVAAPLSFVGTAPSADPVVLPAAPAAAAVAPSADPVAPPAAAAAAALVAAIILWASSAMRCCCCSGVMGIIAGTSPSRSTERGAKTTWPTALATK